MADISVAIPEADATEPAPRRRWPVIAGVVAVALAMLAGFGWRVLGEHPSIGGGSFGWVPQGEVATANDGIGDTKYVLHMVPGRDYVVYTSVANTGRFPFTLTGSAHSTIPSWDLESSATFAVETIAEGVSFTQPFYPTATLNPGRQAAVRVVLRANRCLSISGGGYAIFTQLPVRVRQYGVTTTQHVPLLSLPLYLTDDLPANKLPADCR